MDHADAASNESGDAELDGDSTRPFPTNAFNEVPPFVDSIIAVCRYSGAVTITPDVAFRLMGQPSECDVTSSEESTRQ